MQTEEAKDLIACIAELTAIIPKTGKKAGSIIRKKKNNNLQHNVI